ncbi:hypothetical protein HMN09_00409800 [Mycena chlorophos]|uniref:DUF6533 domain-containing protein n=1 Tax=Mycena chlorophos TaxID=658473 RepID=A0A8H6THE6_MYCCL|nr:hypothetical protein HMN09_00409800 [Mycena chlorophos]
MTPLVAILPTAMDGDVDEQATETIALNSLHLVGISILIWDHFITLGDEIQFIWLRKKTYSSYLFFVVRYLGLLSNIPIPVFSFVTVSQHICTEYSFAHQLLLVATQVIVSIVMILRVFALYNRSKPLLCFLVFIGAVFLGVCIWAERGQHATIVSVLPGCHMSIDDITGYHLSSSWIGLFLFDAIVFSLTLHKTIKTRQEVGLDAPLRLHMLLVRDGALYFAAMAFANLSNILTDYVAGVRPVLARGPFLVNKVLI